MPGLSVWADKGTNWMAALLHVRRLLRNIRGSFTPNPRKKARPILAGLPAGITFETLNNVLHDHFGESLVSCSHQHLSGWKPSGAFRLFLKTHRGNETRLIFKDASYGPEKIPALVDLPIHPGPPEYAIYSRPAGALTPYLPRVYMAEEKSAGEQYHYLLEDLGQNHHVISSQNDFFRTSSLLPAFHLALHEWVSENTPRNFLHYGKDFSHSLQKYARTKLEHYRQYSSDFHLITTLQYWPQIAEVHLCDEFSSLLTDWPIHGDTNYTNFHLNNHNQLRFRLVDWEWAGFGLPHADLVSLFKGTSSDIEKTAFQKYFSAFEISPPLFNKNRTLEENWRVYLWCKLERGLLDASFLSVQFLHMENVSMHAARFSLPNAISNSLKQVLSAYKQLSN